MSPALDADACYAAVRARDRRFDGRFVTGVLSTGIYCRPSCPARTPKRINVRFFASPAAAQAAGLRACRRCRPELAPDHPGYDPHAHLAARVLRLIDAGVADDGVPTLAARVHVSPRHLQRIMIDAYGAPPAALARMRRVRLARMLIDQTDLPLAQIAFAAGFGSIRQFNDAFRDAFQTTPSRVRAGHAATRPAALRLHLPARSPFDGQRVRRWRALHLVDGIEAVVGDSYRRHTGSHGVVTMTPTAEGVFVIAGDGDRQGDLRPVVAMARRVFDLDADAGAISAALASDPVLRPVVRALPGLRLPGVPDGFEGAVRVILGQQVSTTAASTLMSRLVALAPDVAGIPDPASLTDAPLEEAIGLTRQRAGALRALATAVAEGTLLLDPHADPDVTRGLLLDLPGIGPWSAGAILLSCLGHPDAWPAGDLALRRAVEGLTGRAVSGRELDRMAERWRPWRAYAAIALWNRYLDQTMPDWGIPSGRAEGDDHG